jgi:aminoglycoside 6'-N-acetyltransferase I
VIESCTSVHQPGWLELRSTLWPDEPGEHLAAMAEQLAAPQRYAQFVSYGADGAAAGLVEAAIRSDYVNGTETSPVAFLEGIYVAPAYRQQGWARKLVDAVVAWALAQGCTELASDAALENVDSHRMHEALGFDETERVVYFRRVLKASPENEKPAPSQGERGF